MLLRHPAAAYAAPFACFILCLALLPKLPLTPRAQLAVWLAAGFGAVSLFSRQVLDFRLRAPAISVAVGAAVFIVWVAPDLLFPALRSHWLFSNALLGSPAASLSPAALGDPAVLAMRTARAVLLVPVVEELFWRGFLMRWLEHHDFGKVPLGSWEPRAFWTTAALFALEHGSYWDVGFLAGAAYNAWMVRTKSLGDLILAHAVTNACLAAYVLWTQRYEYWL